LSQAMAARGQDLTASVRVVEGNDQGATLALADEGRAYVLGRGAECDLPLSDADASREHAHVERRGNSIVVRDLGAKNGTWLGDARAPENRAVVWRPAQMMRIGRTVLALVEPLGDALAKIESAPDEKLSAGDAVARPVAASALPAPVTHGPPPPAPALAPRRRPRFSAVDLAVMVTAVCILGLSLAGLLWLLHG